MSTFIFPGQGSQIKGMGRELFSDFPDLMSKSKMILGYSIEELCLEDPNEKLNQTQYTQPALFIVNTLTYLKKIDQDKTFPRFLVGHSLGEYNALLAAGVFDFETGLQLVKKRGELMSQSFGGAMIAVVGLKIDTVTNLLSQYNLAHVSVANHNSHTQVVLSGLREEIEQAKTLCEQAGAMLIVPLKVSGAFHSPHMKNAQDAFREFVRQFKFLPPKIPVIANTTAQPYTLSDIPEQLIQQITLPVRWTESIDYLIAQNETNFEEIGPGTVLSGLVRRIKNGQ